MSASRHVRAVVLLPGIIAVAVPGALVAIGGANIAWGLSGVLAALLVALGCALIVAGFALWAWTLRLLAFVGRGTLAPWDPTRCLVTQGPYARMRNPMITAVLAVLAGEAALLGTILLPIWCGVFFAVNHAYFVLREEPDLRRRFGEQYRAYRSEVPRWVPRLR